MARGLKVVLPNKDVSSHNPVDAVVDPAFSTLKVDVSAKEKLSGIIKITFGSNPVATPAPGFSTPIASVYHGFGYKPASLFLLEGNTPVTGGALTNLPLPTTTAAVDIVYVVPTETTMEIYLKRTDFGAPPSIIGTTLTIRYNIFSQPLDS